MGNTTLLTLYQEQQQLPSSKIGVGSQTANRRRTRLISFSFKVVLPHTLHVLFESTRYGQKGSTEFWGPFFDRGVFGSSISPMRVGSMDPNMAAEQSV